MSEAPRSANGGRVQSLERAFELLGLVAEAGGELGLSRLASGADLPVPTAHRLVRTLVAGGYLHQLPSRRYALGPRLIGLGALASSAAEGWAGEHLRVLAEASGETANLAMLDDRGVVYVAQVPSSRHTVRMFTEVGRRADAHCTGVGKALLARLPDDDVRAILQAAGMPARTERTLVDVDSFLREMARVRHDGYAVDDGEQELGVRCVAVVVPGSDTSAVSVSGPASRVTHAAVRRFVPLLQQAGEALGGR